MTPDAALPAACSTAAHSTQAMIERIARLRPASTAEALRELRSAFPDSPLSTRITAVAALQRGFRAVTG